MTQRPAKPRKSLVTAFRRAVRRRGDTITDLSQAFGVSRQHFTAFLAQQRASAPLVEKVTRYVQEAA